MHRMRDNGDAATRNEGSAHTGRGLRVMGRSGGTHRCRSKGQSPHNRSLPLRDTHLYTVIHADIYISQSVTVISHLKHTCLLCCSLPCSSAEILQMSANNLQLKARCLPSLPVAPQTSSPHVHPPTHTSATSTAASCPLIPASGPTIMVVERVMS